MRFETHGEEIQTPLVVAGFIICLCGSSCDGVLPSLVFFRRICVPTTLLGRHAEIIRAARRPPVVKLTCTLAEEFVVGRLL